MDEEVEVGMDEEVDVEVDAFLGRAAFLACEACASSGAVDSMAEASSLASGATCKSCAVKSATRSPAQAIPNK